MKISLLDYALEKYKHSQTPQEKQAHSAIVISLIRHGYQQTVSRELQHPHSFEQALTPRLQPQRPSIFNEPNRPRQKQTNFDRDSGEDNCCITM